MAQTLMLLLVATCGIVTILMHPQPESSLKHKTEQRSEGSKRFVRAIGTAVKSGYRLVKVGAKWFFVKSGMQKGAAGVKWVYTKSGLKLVWRGTKYALDKTDKYMWPLMFLDIPGDTRLELEDYDYYDEDPTEGQGAGTGDQLNQAEGS